jgi:hypothetical protein
MAVLGLLENPNNRELFTMLWNKAVTSFDSSCLLEAEELNQLHHIQHCIEIEGGEEMKKELAPINDELRVMMVDEVRSSLTFSSDNVQRTAHTEISSLLKEMGIDNESSQVPFLENHSEEEGSDKVLVDGAKNNLAIEYLGPLAYIGDVQRRLEDGQAKMKMRLLKKSGKTVITIPWFEWEAETMTSRDDKLKYLKGKLDETN